MLTHTTPYRILLFNVGYGTALDGSLRGYFLRFYRYFYTPRWIIRKVRQSIYNLLNTAHPDLCCFIEIHKKHGFSPHPSAYHSHVDNKYGRWSLLRHLPFFRDNCNGFFAKHSLQFTRRYFRSGTKKLIYDIDLGNGFSLLLVHFSLRQATRRKQAKELQILMRGRKNTIVCGDFNIFRGTRELHALAEACGLHIVNAHQPTFPAIRPRKALDLFLCPKDMPHVTAHVLHDVKIADHLPVLLEVGRC